MRHPRRGLVAALVLAFLFIFVVFPLMFFIFYYEVDPGLVSGFNSIEPGFITGDAYYTLAQNILVWSVVGAIVVIFIYIYIQAQKRDTPY